MIYLASLTEEISDKLERYVILHTREEVAKVVSDNRNFNKIIFRKDYVSKYYTPSGFNSYLRTVRTINPSLVIELDDDYEDITTPAIIQKINNTRTLDELFYLLSAYPKEGYDVIKSLTENVSKRDNTMRANASQIASLQERVNSLERELKDKESAMELLQLSKNAVENRLDVIKNRINNSYAVGYDVDNVFEVGNHKFDRVLYIKEFTRVQYTDTLIYSLKEILKIVHNMPARVIVMEPFYAGGKVQQYDWLKPHYSLTHQDILSGDILMLGLQKKVMEDILKNASNVSFLIVLDRTGSSEPYITGNNVINLYTVSDLADLPAGIDLSYVISYDDRTLTIPYMEDFDKADSSKRLTAYSSLEITKAIISLLVR